MASINDNEAPIDDDEILEYLRPGTYPVPNLKPPRNTRSSNAQGQKGVKEANDLLLRTLESIHPPANVYNWCGGEISYNTPTDWMFRGASTLAIVFRPELYLPLADREEFDPIDDLLDGLWAEKFAQEEQVAQGQLEGWAQGRSVRASTRRNAPTAGTDGKDSVVEEEDMRATTRLRAPASVPRGHGRKTEHRSHLVDDTDDEYDEVEEDDQQDQIVPPERLRNSTGKRRTMEKAETRKEKVPQRGGKRRKM
ncbi:hypothetical protein FN846DRAFT_912240 [Sphaerosporella brunnea]|uniref:Uncharacterized protein n=1 Tax=Sphaerosporella brunnea TaxID=1250544 RepID=A0A5J5EIM6_9PEZI|nr:hypothetical protein FN846DRAFT_912240 [Sphaerosporella brunnea]